MKINYLTAKISIFVVVCAFALALGSNARAAYMIPPTNLFISATSTNALTIAWTGGVADTSTNYIIATSSDNVTFTTTTQATTSPATYTQSNLITNTIYYFRVAAGNGTASSTFIATSGYTLGTANAPTLGTPTNTTFPLAISPGSNPAATTYAIYNSTLGQYLDYLTGGATTTASAFYQATSTWTAAFAATGLTPNTGYQFKVISKNSGSAYNTSTASALTYTNATTPSSLTATVNNEAQITVSWAGDATDYTVVNTTAGVTSGVITASSHAFTNLNCGTTYNFSVTGRNADASLTTAAATVSAVTTGCTGGGAFFTAPPITPAIPATPAVQATPAVPDVSPATPATLVVPAVPATPAVSHALINLPAGLDVSALKAGQTIKYSYAWNNTTGKTKSIKVVRDLLLNGKIVTRATGNYSIKNGKALNFNVKQTFNKKLKAGVYTVMVRIYDRTKGVNIDNASFDLTIQ